MDSFELPAIPGKLIWQETPLDWGFEQGDSLSITAGKDSDFFIDPDDRYKRDDAPRCLFMPREDDFMLSARVEVAFESAFDAGALIVYEHDTSWAKLCFEMSPQGRPTVVSVVTNGMSDDCNSAHLESNHVYLRLAKIDRVYALHYSEDLKFWHLVRYFTLGMPHEPQIGFSAQSPTGKGCMVTFSEILYRAEALRSIRYGK